MSAGSVEIQVWRRPEDVSVDDLVAFGSRLIDLLDEFGYERIASQTGPGGMAVGHHLDALARAEHLKLVVAPSSGEREGGGA